MLRTLQRAGRRVVHAPQRLDDDAVDALVAAGPRVQRRLRPGRGGAQRLGRRRRSRRRATPGSTTRRSPTVYVENLDWESLSTALRLRAAAADARRGVAQARDRAISTATATDARGRLRRPRRLHRAQPELEDDELGALVARFEALTHDTVAGAGRPGGEDHRRRGDVRLRGAGGHAPRSRSGSPSGPVDDAGAARRAGRARLRVAWWPARATTTGRSSTSRTGSSRSRTRAASSPPTSSTTPSRTTRRSRGGGPGTARSATSGGSRPGRCEPGTARADAGSVGVDMSDATTPLRLLSVHAHPDDEASKGAATVAKYAAEGIRGVLVCCTGGEEGEILNPAVDTPEVRANLHEVRMQELAGQRRRDRLRAALHARVPRLGDEGHRGERPARTTSRTRRSTRPSSGSCASSAPSARR